MNSGDVRTGLGRGFGILEARYGHWRKHVVCGFPHESRLIPASRNDCRRKMATARPRRRGWRGPIAVRQKRALDARILPRAETVEPAGDPEGRGVPSAVTSHSVGRTAQCYPVGALYGRINHPLRRRDSGRARHACCTCLYASRHQSFLFAGALCYGRRGAGICIVIARTQVNNCHWRAGCSPKYHRHQWCRNGWIEAAQWGLVLSYAVLDRKYHAAPLCHPSLARPTQGLGSACMKASHPRGLYDQGGTNSGS